VAIEYRWAHNDNNRLPVRPTGCADRGARTAVGDAGGRVSQRRLVQKPVIGDARGPGDAPAPEVIE